MTLSQQAPSLVERLNEPVARNGETTIQMIKRWREERAEAAAKITELEARAERAEAQCRVFETRLSYLWKIARDVVMATEQGEDGRWRVDGDAEIMLGELYDALETERLLLSLSGGGEPVQKKHELEPAANHPGNPDSSSQSQPNPRSHDEQHSDGAWRRPPYIFHSLSACAGCGCSGDYFPAPDAAAYEATGELYCDECAEEAIAQALGNQ